MNTKEITISWEASDRKNNLSMFGKERGFLVPLAGKAAILLLEEIFPLLDFFANIQSNKVLIASFFSLSYLSSFVPFRLTQPAKENNRY